MVETLTAQDKIFVKEVIKDGNKTKAVKKAYGITDDKYASVKGQRLIGKDRIQKAIKSIADSIPDKLLVKVHLEGLKANKRVFNESDDGETIDEGSEPDYAVRHKYLDSAYKIKGTFAPEKSININLDVEEEQLRAIIKGIKGK